MPFPPWHQHSTMQTEGARRKRHPARTESRTKWSSIWDLLPWKSSLSSTTTHRKVESFPQPGRKPLSYQSSRKERTRKSSQAISLLGCLGEPLERIINKRLRWHLEANNLIHKEQPRLQNQPEHSGSTGPSCTVHWKCLSGQENNCGLCRPIQSIWQSEGKETPTKIAEPWSCWKHAQVDREFPPA